MTNPELLEFLRKSVYKQNQNVEVAGDLTKHIDQFTLTGEFTKSIRNYASKLISYFDERIRESTEKPDFSALVKSLSIFFLEVSKLNKSDYPAKEYALKVRNVYRSLTTPKKTKKVYRNSGRRRIVELDEKTRKVVNRKAKPKEEKVLTYYEKLMRNMV